MLYNINIIIQIKVHGPNAACINYGIDDRLSTTVINKEVDLLVSETISTGPHTLLIELTNKTNDTSDLCVEIVDVVVEGLTLDRVKWSGKYYPNYPEPWASQQAEPLPEVHNGVTFLGWNGAWKLEFTAPIFSWLHKIENLGWLYT